MVQIGVDSGSDFCLGVMTAIQRVQEELARGETLCCLDDIVHNGIEVKHLHERGLVTINHDDLHQLHDVKVLLRAHGEPPETYELARRNNIGIIDTACPMVLALQRRIKKQYENHPDAQIVIFGKTGHAEVLGLVGQTQSNTIVIEKVDDVKLLDFSRNIYLYSRTTKSLDGLHRVVNYVQSHILPNAVFRSFDTICRQVANRIPSITNFTSKRDLILFMNGRKSSNGRVSFKECKRVSPNNYHIEDVDETSFDWLQGVNTTDIYGAASTPEWLMEECRDYTLQGLGR